MKRLYLHFLTVINFAKYVNNKSKVDTTVRGMK